MSKMLEKMQSNENTALSGGGQGTVINSFWLYLKLWASIPSKDQHRSRTYL